MREAYMTNSEVITSIAGDLNTAEQSLDAAIARTTTLIQTMIGARTALNLTAVSGAASQARAMEAIAAMSAARDALVACHEELAKDHRRHGFGVYAIGILNKPAEAALNNTDEQARVSRLRAV
jgi:NAD(P)-dependent dehydrogenase (short-subunit alcohol dehydrogenase family)